MTERRRWTMERGTLWLMDFGDPTSFRDLPAITPRISARLAEVHQNDAEALALAMGLPDGERMAKRFASGRRCFAAWAGGQIATYGWVSQGSECVGELEREIRIQSDDSYIWDCATLRPFRQKYLYSALLRFMTGVLQAETVRRVWIGSAQTNWPSLQGFANAGFRPVINLTYMRFFRMGAVWFTGIRDASTQEINTARQMFTAHYERSIGALVVGCLPITTPPTCE